MKKITCFIFLLLLLVGCNNKLSLEGTQPPNFELSILHAGDSVDEPTILDKDILLIEDSYWNEPHDPLSDDQILSSQLDLHNRDIKLESYKVVLDKYIIDFDFSQATNKPDYFICIIDSEEQGGAYWKGEIPENGVFEFTPPYTGVGITKAEVTFQWRQDDSTILGEQSIRFKLDVVEE